MSKKIIAVAATLPLIFGIVGMVAAQSVVGGTGSASAGAAIIVNPGNGYPTPGWNNGGFIQLNNLSVQSVSDSEIDATAPGTCWRFPTMNSAGMAANCPMPPQPQPIPCTPAVCPMSVQGSGANQPAQNGTMPCIPVGGPMSPCRICLPIGTMRAQGVTTPYCLPGMTSYRIMIDSQTRLFFRDRTLASIGDFSEGDQINVFGFYNYDGSVNALVVRDLSKPIENQFIQLNNVTLIAISGSNIVVAQQPIYPCYSYGPTGASAPIKYPCPYPMNSPAALNNTTVPQSLMPVWNNSLKYDVHIDASTVLLDRTRNTISMSNMRIGDMLNIYGETGAVGEIAADVVRDLDIPAATVTSNGTITQVNADGSFVMQLDDGTTVTVQSALTIGAHVSVTGSLDRTQNIISQVSDIRIGNSTIEYRMHPLPVQNP